MNVSLHCYYMPHHCGTIRFNAFTPILTCFFVLHRVFCLGGRQEAAAAKGQPPDPRPTIVFSTIDHPIMRDWASSGVDVEVFPSGLVLEEMDSSAVRFLTLV